MDSVLISTPGNERNDRIESALKDREGGRQEERESAIIRRSR